jgi:hypothetical protein
MMRNQVMFSRWQAKCSMRLHLATDLRRHCEDNACTKEPGVAPLEDDAHEMTRSYGARTRPDQAWVLSTLLACRGSMQQVRSLAGLPSPQP